MTNLTFFVEPSKNTLDGITLYEPVERSILVKLINSTLLKETFNNKMAGVVYKTEKQQLQRHLVRPGTIYDSKRAKDVITIAW